MCTIKLYNINKHKIQPDYFGSSLMHQLYKQQKIKNMMLQSANITSISARYSNILAPSIPIQNTQAMSKRRDLLNKTPK